MSFISGNGATLELFEKAKKEGKVSHAYIIEGPDGSGKGTLARAISAILVCEEASACYSCSQCKKVISGVHQDVRELSRKEGSLSIGIDEISEIIRDAYIKPAEASCKIFIIKDSQTLTPASQNALLQIFEEPPRNVVFLLLTTNRNLLLPTLKSRGVVLKTEKFSDTFIKKELSDAFPQDLSLIDEATLVADGALGLGIEFLSNNSLKNSICIVKKYFEAVASGASFADLSLIFNLSVVKEKESIPSLLGYFSLSLRDVLMYQAGYEGRAMILSSDALRKELATRLSREQIFSACDVIRLAITDYASANPTVTLSSVNLALSKV